MTDPINLDELEARGKAATPAPWWQPVYDEPRLISGPGGTVSLLGLTKDDEAIIWSEADAALIVAMCNSLDTLIAEVRALRAVKQAVHELSTCALGRGNSRLAAPALDFDLREIERLTR